MRIPSHSAMLRSTFMARERVVQVLALVVDAAHPGAEHEVPLGQDLVPQRFDLVHLGEEAVATEVEAPPVPHHRAADTADHVIRLEHDRVLPPFRQEIGRGQASGARAGDDDGRFLVGGHDGGRLVDPPRALGEGGGLPGGPQEPAPAYSVRFIGS